MAGVEGIEPTSAVLETAVLPLYNTPMVAWLSFLRLPQALLTVHPLYKQTSHSSTKVSNSWNVDTTNIFYHRLLIIALVCIETLNYNKEV